MAQPLQVPAGVREPAKHLEAGNAAGTARWRQPSFGPGQFLRKETEEPAGRNKTEQDAPLPVSAEQSYAYKAV